MTDETHTEPLEEQAGMTATEEQPKMPDKLQQTVDLRDVGPCKKHIKVSIDRASIDKRMGDKFSELVASADTPISGFRPGKAPRQLVEKRFHKEVSDQVKGEVLLQSLQQLAEDFDVAPLSPPNLDPSNIEIPKTGPLVYEFEVEVRPQFELPNYTGMKLRRPVRTFGEEDVDEEERRILAPYGQLVPKAEGKAQMGDYVIADVNFKSNGKSVGEIKEAKFRVERQVAFKDAVAEKFAEQVKGASAGESRTIEITLSGSVAVPELAGKKIQGELKIHDIKTMRPPELTHEFLHEFGVHSPDQLRERIRVLLNRRLEYHQRQSARAQVLGKITSAATWDLPNDLLMRQARSAMGRRVMEMRASGMNDEEIQGRLRVLQQDILQSTAVALKEHFVLQKIAETEKIDVTEEDINDEIDRLAYLNNESPRRIRAKLEKEDHMESLAIELVERKVLDLILSSAEYEDVPMEAQEDSNVSSVENQAVSGEMIDPTAGAEQPAVPQIK